MLQFEQVLIRQKYCQWLVSAVEVLESNKKIINNCYWLITVMNIRLSKIRFLLIDRQFC